MFKPAEEILKIIEEGDAMGLFYALGGEDYDRGKLEALEAECEKLRKIVSTLICVLPMDEDQMEAISKSLYL